LNREEKVSILLAEQNASMALRVVQYGYVLESGRVVLDGDAEQLRVNEDIKEFYLGLTGVGRRRSYRDVKHYRRRKRWLSCTVARDPQVAARRPARPAPSVGGGGEARRGPSLRAAHERPAQRPGRLQVVRRGPGRDRG